MRGSFGYALTFLTLILLPGAGMAAGVTPDQIEALTGATASAPQLDQASLEHALDHQAEMATLVLGKDNPQWNDKNPKWQTVYSKVRADIAEDTKPLLDYRKQSHQDVDAMIAEHMDPADIKAITDYLNTDEGERYQAFSKKVDALMHDSMSKLMGQSPAQPPPPVKLSKEQLAQYMKLLGASRPVQILAAATKNMAAHETNSKAGDIFTLTQAATIKLHPDEVAALNDDYSGDVDKFDAFNQSPAQQHLFASMANAMWQMTEKTRTIANAQLPNEKKHRDEWKVLYQHEVESQ